MRLLTSAIICSVRAHGEHGAVVRALTPGEIAFLLNGQRADGQEIDGKKKEAATQSLRTIFDA